jgi:hypothetical protein
VHDAQQEQLERTMSLLHAEQQLHKSQRETSEQNDASHQAALRSLQHEVACVLGIEPNVA